MRITLRSLRIPALLLPLVAGALSAQGDTSPAPAPKAKTDSASQRLGAVTITATRRATDVQQVPAAVSVLDAQMIRERTPNNAADLLRELPGMDVVGTGPNQVRPSIRGQRGQRILLMQDGLRLNNSRRQQDFGELPALVDVGQIERVEIVRGPSSVLYGSDAIGGVINLITRAPRPTGRNTVSGQAGYRYTGAGEQHRTDGAVTATYGRFAFTASGAVRQAQNYRAPAGSFGGVRLADDVELQDSGVRDQTLNLYAGWRGTNGHGLWLRQEAYQAEDAGFGFVEPRVLGDTSSRIQIRYPWQAVNKTTAGYNSGALGWALADKLDVTAYTQRNARDFSTFVDVYVPMGPGRTGVINSRSFNYTDVQTVGFRAEATKVLSRVAFTYGADLFRDNTTNSDSSWTRMAGFGPPSTTSRTTAQLPNATMRNLGVFLQGDWRLADRLSVITGARFHDVHAETRATRGITAPLLASNNSTTVYAFNAIYRLTDQLNVVGTFGRGFRAPNLIERYFNGPSTDGTAIQIASPDLKPETSKNVDLGLKWRSGRVGVEAFYFRNDVRDGIVQRPTGRTIGRQAEYQNVNIARLLNEGTEISADVLLGQGFSLGANHTKLDSRDPDRPAVPIADTFSSKTNLSLGYRPTSGRFWAEGAVRRNWRQRDIPLGTSPIGAELPAFTVVNLRGGVRLFELGGQPQMLSISVNNLTNALYAEAANSGFFRPEPARHVIVGVTSRF